MTTSERPDAVRLTARQSSAHVLQVLAPSLLWGSGGHRTILTNLQALAGLGVDVRLFVEDPQGTGVDLDEQLQLAETLTAGITRSIDIRVGWAAVDPRLPTLATAAQTTATLEQCTGRRLYFIQDRESLFNPAGTAYLAAERSYLLPADRIAIGRWIPHFLWHEFGVRAHALPFGVDKSIYRPGLAPKAERPRLAVLVQPEKPRRLNELLLESLHLLAARRPDVDIVFFGSNLHVPFDLPAKHAGLIPEARAAALYNSSWVGVCLSATNPSRVPFEMVASGLRVVDVFAANTLFDYPRPQVGLAYGSATSLASAIEQALVSATGEAVEFEALWTKLATRSEEASAFARTVQQLLAGTDLEPSLVETEQELRLDYDFEPSSEQGDEAERWRRAVQAQVQMELVG